MTVPVFGNSYRFHLHRALHPHEKKVLDTIPGFSVRKGATEIRTPYDAAWVLVDLLKRWRIRCAVEEPKGGFAHPRPWPGEEGVEDLQAKVLACPGLSDWLVTGHQSPWGEGRAVLDYQWEALWFGLERSGMLMKMPGGSGKTCVATMFSALDENPGPSLVVTKSPVVTQYARWLERFTNTEVLELRPPSKSLTRKGRGSVWDGSANDGDGGWVNPIEVIDAAESITAYLKARQESGERGHVVVGWGSLRIHMATLLGFQWRTVALDECHTARSDRRLNWKGKTSYDYLDNLSCAAWRIAASAPRRLAFSATPMFNRRLDLWGALTCVDGPAWSPLSSKRFKIRYCDGTPGTFGGWDAKGTTNTAELQGRMSFIMHDVPESISHAALPKVRIFAYPVGGREQDRTQGFKGEMKRLARLVGRGGQDVDSARGLLKELQYQEAAARVRTASFDLAQEYIDRAVFEKEAAAKGKVLLFTGRHIDCYDLYERALKRWAATRKCAGAGMEVWCGVDRHAAEGGRSKWRHELISGARRQDIQDAYMDHPGPCMLVVTDSWGTGLDLQDTDVQINNMLPWQPGALDQRIKRIQRHGMTRPCDVALMTAVGTAAERIAGVMLEKSADMIDLVHQEGLVGVRDTMLGRDRRESILAGIRKKVEAAALDNGGWEVASEETSR